MENTKQVEYFGVQFTVTYEYHENLAQPVRIIGIRTDEDLTELFFCFDYGRRLSALEGQVAREVSHEQ